MPSMIDHIVIVDQDLDVLTEQATSAGFTVTPGGEHAGGVTHNALIPFQDGSYIELIAFIEPDRRTSHRWWPRLWKGGGLADFALLSDDLERDVAGIKDRGLPIPAPEAHGRLRPDGERLEWQSSLPQPVVGETGMPFLIEDLTPRTLRVPHEPEQTTHPNGVVGIAGVTLLVDDLDTATSSLQAITGNEVVDIDLSLPGIERSARVEVGTELGQWVVAVTADMSHEDDFGDAALPARYIDKYGLGPFTALLTTGERPSDLAPDAGKELDVNILAASRLRIA